MDLTLLKKFFDNQCNEQEVKEVLAWINSSDGRKQINQLIDNYNGASHEEEIDSGSLLNKLHHKIHIDELISLLETSSADESLSQPNKLTKTRSLNALMKVAAVIGIFLLTAVGLYYMIEPNTPSENIVTNENVIEKSTEKGQKLTIHLNDGSKVILNAASQISYSKHFTDSIRLVKVKGEAYFEVAKDKDRPFIVQTGDVSTVALGTSFNVFYREEISKNNVALISGKVKVYLEEDAENTSVILNPGERINFSYPDKTLEKDQFDLEFVTAWKDGIIYFKDAGFTEVVNTLENWYGVDISWNGQPKDDWKFSARFENESLKNILEAFKYAQELDYKLNDENVTINFK